MTFRFEKLTVKAQQAVSGAQSLASEKGHPQIDALHLLSAMLDESNGVVRPIIERLGINRNQLAEMVGSELERLPRVSGGGDPQVSPDLGNVLEASVQEAESMNDEYVSTEHLLIARAEDETGRKIEDMIAWWRDYAERNELEARRELLTEAMDVLNDRERDILTQRRLAEQPVTLEELSGVYDVSRERIRQIEVRAFEKLQKAMKTIAGEKLLPGVA